MSQEPFRPSIRTASLLILLATALSASSCGHTKAAVPEVSMDTVMQAVRDYGRDRPPLLAPGLSGKPEETNEMYCAHIRNLLYQEQFDQLEKIAQQNRIEKGRVIGGIWKIVAFYAGAGAPSCVAQAKDSDYTNQIELVNKWIAAHPDSSTAHLSLAYLYINFAGHARGGGFAEDVSDEQWKLFHERTSQAKAILIESSSLKDKDPFWYDLMQLVAHHEGWKQEQVRELFEKAVAFEPGFYHYYVEYARYLLPQWYGNPGDVPAFAEEISNRVANPDGSMLYFWIVSQQACYCRQAMEDLPRVNYPKVHAGYKNIERQYGVSNLNANRFAFFATRFADQESARDGFAKIDKMDESIWTYQAIFDASRDWALSATAGTRPPSAQ